MLYHLKIHDGDANLDYSMTQDAPSADALRAAFDAESEALQMNETILWISETPDGPQCEY